MWFSSGGTKSVVHTDSVDNINCLFRGEKMFLFIDPAKYGDKVSYFLVLSYPTTNSYQMCAKLLL